MADSEQPRLVVGVSGASGIVYGLRALDACRELGVESHLSRVGLCFKFGHEKLQCHTVRPAARAGHPVVRITPPA